MSDTVQSIVQPVTDLFSSGAATDTVGAFGNGANVASDAAASNIAGAVPDATSAIPAASSASIPLGSAAGSAFSATDLTGSQPVDLSGGTSNLGSFLPVSSIAQNLGTTGGGFTGAPADLSAGPTAGLSSSFGSAPTAGAAPTFTASAAPATAGITGGVGGVAGLGNGLGDFGGTGLTGLDTSGTTANLGDTYKTDNPLLTGGATPSALTPAAAATPAAPAASGGKSFMDTLLGNNGLLGLAGPAISALGLGMAAQKGNQAVPFTNQNNGIAQNLMQQGQAVTQAATPLINALNPGNGTVGSNLPAGASAEIDQAVKAQQAHIRSQYAQMGLSGSTMETQALQETVQWGEQQKFQTASQLVNQGIGLVNAGTGESNTAAQIYQALQRALLGQDAALGTSISNFASALAGQPARGQQTQPQQ